MKMMKKLIVAVLAISVAASMMLVGTASAAVVAPAPNSTWSFTDVYNGGNATLDPVGYINLDTKDSTWSGIDLVNDPVKGMVPENGCFGSSRWGDGSSPFYFDIQNSSYTISMDIKLQANRAQDYCTVIMGDCITTPGNSNEVTDSWAIWADHLGNIMFVTHLDGVWDKSWYLGTVNADEWFNFTVVFDGTAKTITSYVNYCVTGIHSFEGIKIMEPPVDTVIDGQQSTYWNGFMLGRCGSGWGGNIQGTFYNAKMWKSALNKYQINQNYLNPTTENSVYQGTQFDGVANPEGITGTDNQIVVVFGTINAFDSFVGAGVEVSYVEGGETKSREFFAQKQVNGKYGIALFNVPAGEYTARTFSQYDGIYRVYGETVSFTVA